MDNQQNQQPDPQQPVNPGQTYQPGQAIQPQQPPTPAPLQPQQQIPPQQAAAPTPAQQPIQQPVPQQTYQQQPYPVQPQPVQQYQAPPASGLNVKRLLMFAGGFVGLLLLLLVAVSLFSGSSLPIEPHEQDDLSFVVSMPVDWDVSGNDLTSLDIITAKPLDAGDDKTTISAVRFEAKDYEDINDFTKYAEEIIKNLSDTEYQGIFGIEVSDFKSEKYGSDDKPGYKISFKEKDIESGVVYSSLIYLSYESPTSAVRFAFLYSDEHSSLGKTASAITNSYSTKEAQPAN